MECLQGPILVTLASFSAFVALGREMTADIAFPALALFNLLRQPLQMLPNYVNSLINARVSLGRMQAFLRVSPASRSLEISSLSVGAVRPAAAAVADAAQLH